MRTDKLPGYIFNLEGYIFKFVTSPCFSEWKTFKRLLDKNLRFSKTQSSHQEEY